MSNVTLQLHTIDLDSLTTVTGGAGGENGGPASERPREKGLSRGQKILVGGAGPIGLVGNGGGPEDMAPRRIKLPPTKPPITITQPKFDVLPA
jgi:hypothetical protein